MSEDTVGAEQGPLEFYKFPYPVVDNGPEGSYDEGYMGEPCVEIIDGLYEMWYEAIGYPPYGGGHRWTIAYASSQDGVHWQKDPNKQFLPNSQYSWCNEHVLEPWVFKDGDRYRIYFSANLEGGTNPVQIGYAESMDGVHWSNYQLVVGALQLNGKKIDGKQIKGASEPSVVKRGDGDYIMYFQAETEGGVFDHIGYALSQNGVTFTVPTTTEGNHAPAWNSSQAWRDVRGLAGPAVIQHRGLYYLFCNTWSTSCDIGYAVSPDGIHFSPAKGNPVLTTTAFGYDDSLLCYEPAVQILENGKVQLWWNGVRAHGGRDSAPYVAAIAYGFAYLDAPANSLICHWPLDESEGEGVRDVTEFGHYGENQGAKVGVVGATPETGTAYQFDGKDDYLWAHHMPLLNQSSFSVSCYIRPDDLQREQMIVSKWNVEGMFDHEVSHEWRLGIRADGRPFFEVAKRGELHASTTCVSAQPLRAEIWQQIKAEYDDQDSRLTLLVDGKVTATADHHGPRRVGRSVLTVGASRHGTGKYPADMADFFRGGIDDIRLYNCAHCGESGSDSKFDEREQTSTRSKGQ